MAGTLPIHRSTTGIPNGRASKDTLWITLKAVILLIFLCVVWFLIIDIAMGNSDGLRLWFLPATIAAIFLPMVGF